MYKLYQERKMKIIETIREIIGKIFHCAKAKKGASLSTGKQAPTQTPPLNTNNGVPNNWPPKGTPFNWIGTQFVIHKALFVNNEYDGPQHFVDYRYGSEERRDSYEIFQGTCDKFVTVSWNDFYQFYK